MTKVVVVDVNDSVIGAMERKDAIERRQIVRVIRILLFNSRGALFLQKRGPNVSYPGLWDQSVGGHVDEGEDYLTAARRELNEEIGLDDVELKEITKYYSDFEYEGRTIKMFNSLYTAISDKPLKLNPAEVADGKWVTLSKLDRLIKSNTKEFSQGFIKAYDLYLSLIRSKF
jgi:isopentenyldiphosphate isomerase